MLKKIFWILLVCTSVVEAESAQKPVVLNAKQSEWVLRLPSNPTTGFSWFLKDYDTRLLTLEEHRYIAPTTSKMVGVPGMEEWVFKIKSEAFLAPQVGEVDLVYARPWESPLPTAKTIIFVTTS